MPRTQQLRESYHRRLIDPSTHACVQDSVHNSNRDEPSRSNFSESESKKGKKKRAKLQIFLTAGVVEQLADVHCLMMLRRYGGRRMTRHYSSCSVISKLFGQPLSGISCNRRSKKGD
jgi:hypothetical protein